MSKVAILGNGPSGIFAAWAAIQCGHTVDIYDRNPEGTAGQNQGVFYLHDACDIPGLVASEVHNSIIGGGSDRNLLTRKYAEKVYGDPDKTDVSIAGLNGVETCYNSRLAHKFLRIVLPHVKELVVSSKQQLLDLLDDHWAVINTVPLNVFGVEGLQSTPGWIHAVDVASEKNYCIYNPFDAMPWHRMSNIYGYQVTEYPGVDAPQAKFHGMSFVKIKKVKSSPFSSSQDILENGLSIDGNARILFTGRYGAWDKSCLTSDVYYRVLRYFQEH